MKEEERTEGKKEGRNDGRTVGQKDRTNKETEREKGKGEQDRERNEGEARERQAGRRLKSLLWTGRVVIRIPELKLWERLGGGFRKSLANVPMKHARFFCSRDWGLWW